jgi:hypothetical protein
MKIIPMKSKTTGERFLSVDGGIIHIGVAALCTDRRISGFGIKCTECREVYPVRELNEGGYCESCVAVGMAEYLD